MKIFLLVSSLFLQADSFARYQSKTSQRSQAPAFTFNNPTRQNRDLQGHGNQRAREDISTSLFAENKMAQLVSGEELEKMLGELDQPLVVDAYATWCGPCLLMSPEFESAAVELQGRVRFVKLDTDKDESMAARLQIQGLPTLLFLDKYEGDEDGAKAVLKGRIEGALRKTDIVSLCEHYYFGAPAPELF